MRYCLIVEDIPAVAASQVRMATEVFPGIVLEVSGDLAAARTALAQRQPDLILLDIGLPDGEGTELLREGIIPTATQVIITTIFDDDDHLFAALRAGAHGYLLKDEPEERFMASLRDIGKGQPPLSAPIARRIMQSFIPKKTGERLTQREVDVLSLIARGHSLQSVATKLGLTRNTAASYLKVVYQKLHISSRAEAALSAKELGLL